MEEGAFKRYLKGWPGFQWVGGKTWGQGLLRV